jgi:hypothetical protein
MHVASYSAHDAAIDVLRAASTGKTHIVLPGTAKFIWLLKRAMPSFFLRKLLPLGSKKSK